MGATDGGAASAAPFDPLTSSWRVYELTEGETLAGTVLRLPQAGAFNGSRLFVRKPGGEVLAIRATGKQGHTVLENQLKRHGVEPGHEVSITFEGWGTTTEGYNVRLYDLRRRT